VTAARVEHTLDGILLDLGVHRLRLLTKGAFESILRRAARGHRLAWRLLIDHTPTLIEAESRWLFPALLRRRPGGARRRR
jgi:hypothetical protein